MQYLIQIFSEADVWERLSETEQAPIPQEYMHLGEDTGVRGGAQLQPADTATTVRVQDSRTLTTDGPFAETKEAIAGYWGLEADDLDGAVAFAARIPAARLGGAVEVRPLVAR